MTFRGHFQPQLFWDLPGIRYQAAQLGGLSCVPSTQLLQAEHAGSTTGKGFFCCLLFFLVGGGAKPNLALCNVSLLVS